MANSITQQAPPDTTGFPNVEFRPADFSVLVFQKGYDVIWEKAERCPCGTLQGNRSSCQNCRGFGYIFIDPIKTRMVIQSINNSTKYENWSEEKIGRVNITADKSNRLAFYDRITFVNDYSRESEIKKIQSADGNPKFIFPSFTVDKLIGIKRFVADNLPLENIPESEYTISENKLTISFTEASPVNEGDIISLTYEYKTKYEIIDVPHETRSSYAVNDNGKQQNIKLPVMAIGQRVHVIQDRPDLDNGGIVYNT